LESLSRGATTLSIKPFSIMTLSIKTFSIMTLSIKTFSITINKVQLTSPLNVAIFVRKVQNILISKGADLN
jgi:hypothetical protein